MDVYDGRGVKRGSREQIRERSVGGEREQFPWESGNSQFLAIAGPGRRGLTISNEPTTTGITTWGTTGGHDKRMEWKSEGRGGEAVRSGRAGGLEGGDEMQ